MELRHIRYFTAVAETLNISRAASQLRITQPALSRQIRDLEADLGLPLFERGARRLRLTAAARDLLEHGRQVLNEVDAFRQRALALQDGETGVLRVGATPQTLERLFAPVLARYVRLQPRVEVQLFEKHPAAALEALRTGELHLGCTLHQPEGGAGSRLLGVVPLLAVRKASPRQRGERLDVRALDAEPLLLLMPGFGSRDLFDAACRVAGVQPRVLLQSAAAQTLLAFAREGAGTAVLPGSFAFGGRGLCVRRLELDGAPLEARVAVQWNPGRFLPAYAERFIALLAEQASLEYAGGGAPSRRASR